MERALRLFAGMLVFAVSASAGAQRVEAPEASVKAAFLYKFAGYVEWPPRTGGVGEPFTIGVLDSDAVAQELEKLVPGRSIAGRPVAVRRVRHGDPVAGLQLLFAGGPTPDRDAIRAAQAQGALVVTESRDGLAAGSAINFVMTDDHVGFEVSIDGAERSGLRISARMLAVARRVVQKGA